MKTKRIVSLLLAFVMLFAISAPVAASMYDASRGQFPPATSWRLFRHYHWVTRGETLQDIADLWAPVTGATVSNIRFLNSRYFNDLALRNTTLGIDVEVEPAVRLHVGFSLQARHYVRRGDTPASIAGGGLVTPGGFALVTDWATVQAQNANWFAALDAWNRTAGLDFQLVESYAMINIMNLPLPGLPDFAPANNVLRNTMTSWGAPLYISVPVNVSAVVNPAESIPLTAVTYMASNVEQVAQVSPFQWSPFHPPLAPPAPLPGNPMYLAHPILGAVVGLVQVTGLPAFTGTLSARPIPGVGGASAPAAAPVTLASGQRFTQPIDPQPAGAVALRVDTRGSGATVLANIASARGTTVANIRSLNPAYFAYVNARGVALEYGAFIWVP